MMTSGFTLKYLVPVMALILLWVDYAVLRFSPDIVRRHPRVFRGLLVGALAVAAILGMRDFTSFYWTSGKYFNYYESFHYYVGAKYAPELGYGDFYKGVVIAQTEVDGKLTLDSIRDLNTHEIIPAKVALEEADAIRKRFTPERWAEFKQDIEFHRKPTSASLWRRMLTDKGYNAPPVWTMIGGFLATAIPVTNGPGMQLIASLDLILTGMAFVCLWWAFGPEVALLWLAFFGSHYLISTHMTLRAAFLRLDWVMCLVMAVCMLKKGGPATAGALVAYAALVRVFPLVFLFGIIAVAAWDLIRTRRVAPRYIRFCLGFAAATVMLVVASILYTGGMGAWKEFLSKISLHNSDISAWRIGFKYVFVAAWDGLSYGGRPIADVYSSFKPLYMMLQLGALVLMALALWHRADWEALALGYGAVFMLVAPTYYYQVMLIVPFIFLAAHRNTLWGQVGLLAMFVVSMTGYKMYTLWNRGFMLYFAISCMLMVCVAYMALMAWRMKTPEVEEASAPDREY